jgi:hypothetical protein
MSRDDVALLAFRTLALWLGSAGAVTVVSALTNPPGLTQIGNWAMLATVWLVVAAGLWRVVIRVVLIAISRRRDLWIAGTDTPAE